MTNVSEKSINEFLDQNQYTEENIGHYEIVFGKQFVATGGKSTTKSFTEMLNLKPNEHVLDFGSGLGGSACYMSANYQVTVLGIDVSKNMVSSANKYLENADKSIQQKVKFRWCDGAEEEFETNSFDCIHTREVVIHIQDKEALFRNFYNWLKPGGRLLISDYCLGNQPLSDEFKEYVSSRKYFMTQISEYEELLKRVGFSSVEATDLTKDCIEILKRDVQNLMTNKSQILHNISPEEYVTILEGWERKLQRCVDGYQAWGLILASK